MGELHYEVQVPQLVLSYNCSWDQMWVLLFSLQK